jgi:hypothetical protein
LALVILFGVGALFFYADRAQREKLKDYSEQMIATTKAFNELLLRAGTFESEHAARVRELDKTLSGLRSDVENLQGKKEGLKGEVSNAESTAKGIRKTAEELLSVAEKQVGDLKKLRDANADKDVQMARLTAEKKSLMDHQETIRGKMASLASAFLQGNPSDDVARGIAFEFASVSSDVAKGILSDYARHHDEQTPQDLTKLIGFDAVLLDALGRGGLTYALWLVKRDEKGVAEAYYAISKLNQDSCEWVAELSIDSRSKKVERVSAWEKWVFVECPSENDLSMQVLYLFKPSKQFGLNYQQISSGAASQTETLPSMGARGFSSARVDVLSGKEAPVKVLGPTEFFARYVKDLKAPFANPDYGLFRALKLSQRSAQFAAADLVKFNLNAVPAGPREVLQAILLAAARRDDKAAVPHLDSALPKGQLGRVGADVLSPKFRVISSIPNSESAIASATECTVAVVVGYGQEQEDPTRKNLNFRRETPAAQWKLASVHTLQQQP